MNQRFSTFFKSFCIVAGLIFYSVDLFAWGATGHETTCAIAERHLTRKAKHHISKALDGKSIVYWATWMDNASHTPEFAYTSTWHYANIDENETFETAAVEPKGDVLRAVEDQIALLKSGKLTKDEEALALKMLVHFVGDMHCPMHMGHKSDKGGNRWQLQFFNQGKNLHSIWDSGVIDNAHKWSFDEWASQLDRVSRKEMAEIVKGTPRDWGKETYLIAGQIYASTPVGSKLSYDYVNEWAPVAEQQLLRAGLRLAYILNDIYR